MGILIALVKKEFLQIIRDPSSIIIAGVLPLVLLFVFGYGVNLDSGRLKIGLVLEKGDPAAASLADALANNRFLSVVCGQDRREFEEQLAAGHLRGVVVIPAGLTGSALGERGRADLQVITDGSEPNVANFVQNYVRGVADNWLSQRLNEYSQAGGGPPVTAQMRFWYNPELKSRNFLIPGSIAIVMTVIGSLLTALVIAREWERGTMEALLATPVRAGQIVLAKYIAYFILAIISMLICWSTAVWWYEVPFRGGFLTLLLVSSVFLLAALGQGLFISTVTKDQYLASQAALISAYLPAFMLSGFIFEISSMPPFIEGVTYVFAARYFVAALTTMFLAGDIWPLIIRCIGAMLLIGLFFSIMIIKKTGKKLD